MNRIRILTAIGRSALRLVMLMTIAGLPLLSPAQQLEFSTKNKQAIKAYMKAAEYMQASDREMAMIYLDKALFHDPQFIEAWMLKGDIWDDRKETDSAIACYKEAVELDPDFFPRTFYNLGRLEVGKGMYQDSKTHYEKYLSYPNPNTNLLPKIREDLRTCNFAIEAMKHPVPFNYKNMGDSINTQYNEYSPTLTVDEQTLIITRQRPRDEQTVHTLKYEEDFFISNRMNGVWSKARRMPPPMNSHGNEGAQCISPDGQFIYLTICNRDDGYGSCDLYYAKRDGNMWTKPVNMGNIVNSATWDSQPSISPDGKTIYFASARSGGKGNMDIWKTTQVSGKWTAPVNLGDSINTEKAEMSPFIHCDGQTLYFTSSGHPGMGGLDIFYARMDTSGAMYKPVNIGYPINTYRDEGFLIVNGKGDKAYFSADYPDGKGGMDLYTFDLYEAARPVSVNYMKGKVFNAKTGSPLEAKFELIDLSSKKTIVESHSDAITGEFLVSLPGNRNYALNVSRESYLFWSENFVLKGEHPQTDPVLKDIPLQPLDTGVRVVLRNIFFDFDKFDLLPESQIELNRLTDLLKKNPKMKIEISGHTDNRGGKEYNQQLSQNRARAVYDYLIQHGIESKRLTYKGYGLAMPIDTNDTDEGRANNRRTEFKVTDF